MYSKEERARLLEDWKASGKSISAYVKEKGLVRWTFTKWIKWARGAESNFVEIRTRELKPTPQGVEILIEKGDIRIHIPLVVGGEELRTIFGALGGAV